MLRGKWLVSHLPMTRNGNAGAAVLRRSAAVGRDARRAAHRARTVLRLREGNSIVLFNDQGGEYRARLAAARSAGVGALQAEVVGFDPIEREPSLHITLIQAQASSDKLDWVIEKAVEIGIA